MYNTAVNNSLMNTYNRIPLTLVKGKGSYVWDDNGNKYLDFTAGIATCNLGHVPANVQEKVNNQLANLWHCTNLFHIPSQQALANLLVNNSCLDKVFFANSGAEANEAAMKIARKYGKEHKGSEAYEIITFTQSFHGRTLATLSATGQSKIQHGFEPLVEGFSYLPFNDLDALKQIDSTKTCAVLLELVQGEGGVNPADSNWIKELIDICHKENILIMVDEIQTGMGRTGSLFAYQQYGFEPDVITLAKGLGSGFPIGAMLAKDSVAKLFQPGTHGSTFGGNPLATTAGLATLEYILHQEISEQAASLGEVFKEKLIQLKGKFNIIQDIRGKGLLLGIVVNEEAAKIVADMRENNVLVLTAGSDVVRILPPLTTNIKEIEDCIDALEVTLTKLQNESI